MSRPWSELEIAALRSGLREGMTYTKVGQSLGRSKGMVAGKIRNLREHGLPVQTRNSHLCSPAIFTARAMISMDREMYEEVKALAAAQDISMSQLIREFIEWGLEEAAAEPRSGRTSR